MLRGFPSSMFFFFLPKLGLDPNLSQVSNSILASVIIWLGPRPCGRKRREKKRKVKGKKKRDCTNIIRHNNETILLHICLTRNHWR